MNLPRWAEVCCALALLSAAALSEDARVPHSALRTLLTAHEAHDLPLEESGRGYPIHLHAVVTFYDPNLDPRHGALFVHDDTGSIFVMIPKQSILPVHAGSVVDIDGVSGNGDYAPVILHAQVRAVGEAHLPAEAIKASMAEMASGTMDGQWVEIEGVVHTVRLTPWNAVFDIATIGGPISATTQLQAGVNYYALIDSVVRIHGNAGPVFNRKSQMVGVHLLFPPNELTVLSSASNDPYSMPVRSLSSLLRYSPGLNLAHRVRIQARVTLQWPGSLLCVQQGNDGLCIHTAQETRVHVGDLVDVIGFPGTNELKATMQEAVFRLNGGSGQQLAARLVTIDQAFRGDYDDELVQIDGVLIGQDHVRGDVTMMIRSGDSLFPAILPEDSAMAEKIPWKEGSTVRLTGICSIKVDPETTTSAEGGVHASVVRILLRSPDDVQVLRSPTWWTTAHSLEVLAAVLIAAIAGFLWVVALRRRVREQTQALRDSEERLRHLSEHDALTNLPNRILLNDRLTMALQRAERFHQRLGLLMVDVDRFKEVNDTYGHPAGDKLLCELAKRISHAVRLTDTVARFGGDEFIILLPDLHESEEAQTIAAKIVAAVSLPFHIGPEQQPLPVTVSVGVCTYPEAGLNMETLLQHVDAAMYSVKAHGRNGFELYRSDGV